MDKEAGQQQISTLYCTLHPYIYIRILRITAGLSIIISVLRTYFYFFFVNIVVWDLPTKGSPYLVVEWPPECNSHGDHLMEWKSQQDLSSQNIYSRGKHEPFLLKINTYIVYMAYFYSTKYHILPCFVHGEIRCAIAGDQVMGMRQ